MRREIWIQFCIKIGNGFGMEIWRLAAKFGEILAKIWAIVGQRVDGRLAIGIFLPRKLMSFYGFQESVASW